MLHIHADDFAPFPFAKEIEARIAEGKESILLVPEQMALATEKALAARYPASAPLYFEVSNFSRLCDRVFRRYGGISYQYTDAAADIILMWKTLDALSPFLLSPKRGAADTVKEGLALFSEITAAGIRASTLKEAASRLPKDTTLRTKLSDLALLTETFTGERDHIYGSLSRDLDKLRTILLEKPVFRASSDPLEEPLFRDTVFFVSGFTSFTAGEAAILAVLMRKSELHISLPLPEEGESSLAYEEVLATRELLLSLKESGTPLSQTEAKTANRPPMLAYAKQMLFRKDGDSTPYEGAYDGALTLIRSRDVYVAASHVAARIAAAVRAGARYRDFTVIARNPEKYDGILDEALLSEGIPVFFAKKASMTEFALTKMILSAYACLDRGFSRADLVSYMKCGFSGLSREDSDLFELYTEVWRLKGSELASDTPLKMYPDGYKTRPTEEDAAALARLNEVRRRLISPLLDLKRDTETLTSATEHAAALYRFLTALDAERKLAEDAEEETARGRHTEAARLLRLFPLLCDLLDRIVTIMGDTPLTRARFSELLSLLFSAIPVYTIPTVMDAVTVADADTFRSAEEHTLFLFGAIEGEFPASVGLDGVFSEAERQQLADLKIIVGKPPKVRASREQFSFLRGIAAAKQAVVLSFDADAMGAATRPSSAFLRLTKLFPALTPLTEDADVFSPHAAKERYHDMMGSAKGDALRPLLFGETEGEEDSRYTTPLFDPDCRVSEATASRLFPEQMVTSQSAIDHFLDCPFAYYCQHALHLNTNETAAIRPIEVGNIVHEILDRFFAYLREEGTDIRQMDPSRIPAYVERAVTDYVARLFPAEVAVSARISHLMYRLRRAAILVCRDLYEEFSASLFTPAFCELKIDHKEGPGMLTFRDKEGKTVSFGGRIDRVDTYLSEEGKLFIRVVDYKSSERKFSREDLKKARNLQMFVYLCAIWKTENERFVKRLSVADKNDILPAGIVYSTANPTLPSLKTPASEEEMKATLAKKNLRRHGFFLSEEAVLQAMDDHLPHMAYSADKKGSYNTANKKQFASLVEFGEMLDDVESAVLATARRMRAGEACITPDKTTDRCPDCPYRALCRIEGVKKKGF